VLEVGRRDLAAVGECLLKPHCSHGDRRLLADLTVPTWKLVGRTIAVASREEIAARIGRSPDFGSAYVLALMATERESALLERFGLEVHHGIVLDCRAHEHAQDAQHADENYSPYRRIKTYSTGDEGYDAIARMDEEQRAGARHPFRRR